MQLYNLLRNFLEIKPQIKDFSGFLTIEIFFKTLASYNRFTSSLKREIEYELILDRLDALEEGEK